MHQQHTTHARTTSIPPSIEVVSANLRGLDPELVQDVTTARRRLEEISPEVIALLVEVRALEERVCVVADGIDHRPRDASQETWERVFTVTGARELSAAAETIARAYPV